jgi:hypothetical protein
MVRPCISKHRAISEGLNDRAADQQAKIEADEAFADEVDRELHEAFLAEEAAATRQSIISGYDPVRDQALTRSELDIALEQLDPPLTHSERLKLQLYLATIDDSVAEDWLYEQNMAWSLHNGQLGDPQLVE